MPSKQFIPPLLDVVPERDSRVVRRATRSVWKALAFPTEKTSVLTSTARHIAVWLALNEIGSRNIRHPPS